MKNLIAVLLIFSLFTPSDAERAKEFIGKRFTNYLKAFPLALFV